jgi:hypothetical protein
VSALRAGDGRPVMGGVTDLSGRSPLNWGWSTSRN